MLKVKVNNNELYILVLGSSYLNYIEYSVDGWMQCTSPQHSSLGPL
jgi:hypothetical protein